MNICIYIYIYIRTCPSTPCARAAKCSSHSGSRASCARISRMGRPVCEWNGVKGKQINSSHTHTHRDRTTPPTPTHTHDKNNTPNPPKNTPHTLNNARRWRDDGACHMKRCEGGVVH